MGKPLSPTTTQDPILRQIFTEQERLGVSTKNLARISHIHARTISELRHPDADKGKRPLWYQVRQLALALDFKWPERLEKNE